MTIPNIAIPELKNNDRTISELDAKIKRDRLMPESVVKCIDVILNMDTREIDYHEFMRDYAVFFITPGAPIEAWLTVSKNVNSYVNIIKNGKIFLIVPPLLPTTSEIRSDRESVSVGVCRAINQGKILPIFGDTKMSETLDNRLAINPISEEDTKLWDMLYEHLGVKTKKVEPVLATDKPTATNITEDDVEYPTEF